MKDLKIKATTIARIVALIVVLANQCLALFGQEVLPFTGEVAYQVATFVLTVVVVCINAWYNNDVTPLARLAGKLFDAMKDGKITTDEVEHLIEDSDKTE